MGQDVIETDRLVLFWGGWPSQWFLSNFVADGTRYNCCEQYMMAEKAAVFGDRDTLAKILASPSPGKQKALGRQVRGFQQETWDRVCRGIVYSGNLAKYQQNARLRNFLLATGDKTIVEASPMDRIWGIGLSKDDPLAHDPAQWQGTNWLGIALMQVREALRTESAEPVLDDQLHQQLKERSRRPR